MEISNIKFDFDDILIEPISSSPISTRKSISPYYSDHLPIIVSPMDTVVDRNNFRLYHDNALSVCIPRNEEVDRSGIYINNNAPVFTSYSLDDFRSNFIFRNEFTRHILIDVANGHMERLLDTVKEFRRLRGRESFLMVGNVANPETYRLLSDAGADYIRIGIGNGNGCLTSQQIGVGFPMASLIKECYDISCTLETPAKIVADGGMKNYSDIIKALALGADYVMLGSIFNKALESSGDTYFLNRKINQYGWFAKWILNRTDIRLEKKFRGMSTKEVQRLWGKKVIKTSEGIVKKQNVDYTIQQWTENFTDYLKSAMSYTGKYDLESFIGQVNYNLISQNSLKRFSK